ncbi:MAG: hypothetical protein WC099_03505 [Candidatus Paceibacterota bacterium]
MKRVQLIAVICFISILFVNYTFGQTEVYKTGDRGTFRYQVSKEDGKKIVEFSIMKPVCGGGEAGHVFGIISPDTKITFTNRNLSIGDLDLLNGKEVLVTGTFKEFGRGEGSKTFCMELTIFVIPEGR